MSKKIVIALAVAAVVLLSGCTSREPIPVHSANSTALSTKLGPVHHHCVHCNNNH